MDPNETPRQIRLLYDICGNMSATPDDACHLANLVDALDEWLQRGGALPDEWTKNR